MAFMTREHSRSARYYAAVTAQARCPYQRENAVKLECETVSFLCRANPKGLHHSARGCEAGPSGSDRATLKGLNQSHRLECAARPRFGTGRHVASPESGDMSPHSNFLRTVPLGARYLAGTNFI